jgi:hypothetical protein
LLAVCVLALAGTGAAAGWSRLRPILFGNKRPTAKETANDLAARRSPVSERERTPRPDKPIRREPPAPPARPTYARDIVPLVNRYCLRCHRGRRPRGGVALDRDRNDDAVLKNRRVWEKVAENLRSGDMPPPGARKPGPVELETLNRWIDQVVLKSNCTGPKNPGRVTLRRLNRAEYRNTIRDLMDVDFQAARDFPADDVGYGFDNIGDVLALPPLLLEKYLDAAGQVVEKAWKGPHARQRYYAERPREIRAKLHAFASRAYRRPITAQELDRLFRLFRSAADRGGTHEEAFKTVLQAVLVSPHFLFRVELDPPPDKPDGVRILNDWELASRLSYFLYSSMPDKELFDHCRNGTLRKPGVLEGQVKRMLRSPKARALADNFASQWLNIRNLSGFNPDPRRFPTFRALRGAMLRETELFFLHVVREDRSVLDFIDGDYTFVNGPLARHYGIKGVAGQEFRKVSLAGTPRAGVLTHASVLAVTSNPTRTSPVKRGKWILDNILGTPPPPPPADVEVLKEGGELQGTLRQRMEQHRKDPTCASCHARMDPLGFGFENFDAVGAWRTKEGRHAIDPSGVLPDGASFKGPVQLRAILKKKRDLFARCLSEKLLTYALGRGTERSDRCFIDEIARDLAKGDYKFSRLVLAIVKSEPFQKRRGKGGKK